MEKLKLGNARVPGSQQYFTPLLSSYATLFDWEMFCVGGWEVVFTSALPFFVCFWSLCEKQWNSADLQEKQIVGRKQGG